MEETDLESRLAATERALQRVQSDLARLEEAVENARRPSLSFVVRIGVYLVALLVAVQFIPGLVLVAGTSLYHSGGRTAVWAVALGVVGVLAICLVSWRIARNRAVL